jgi:hypothetical protein
MPKGDLHTAYGAHRAGGAGRAAESEHAPTACNRCHRRLLAAADRPPTRHRGSGELNRVNPDCGSTASRLGKEPPA